MQSQWTWQHVALLVVSIISWFLVGLVINVSITLSSSDWYYVFYSVMSTGDFWMSLLWFVVLLCGFETFIDGTRRAFFYEPRHILQEVRQFLSFDFFNFSMLVASKTPPSLTSLSLLYTRSTDGCGIRLQG